MGTLTKTAVCFLLMFTATAAHAAQYTDCSVPAARPDDGLDDRVAIQEALDNQGCADLGPGVYNIGINPGGGLAGITTLAMKDGRSLRGTGPRTVLKFAGVAHGDWNGIRMSGTNVLVSDLSIDTSGLTGTSEQAHAIQVQGHPSTIIGTTKGATIRGVWFNHPVRTTSGGATIPGGDCVRLLGEATNNVTVTVTGNHFLDCDRSGIGIQRGTFGAVIAGNTFYRTGDQDIDAEMSGGGLGGGWSITGNIFLPGKLRRVSVALAGRASAGNIVFSDNIMLSGGLGCYNLQHAAVTNNVIVYAVPATSAAMSMIKATDDVLIEHNVIIRTAAAGAGELLSFEHHNSGSPGRISVIGNSFVQQTKSTIASFVSTQDVVVSGNRLHYDAEPGTAIGLSFGGVTEVVDRVLVVGNLFTGPLTTAVQLQAGTIRASVVGNLADQALTGLACGGVGPGGAIVSSGNNWVKNLCAAATPGL